MARASLATTFRNKWCKCHSSFSLPPHILIPRSSYGCGLFRQSGSVDRQSSHSIYGRRKKKSHEISKCQNTCFGSSRRRKAAENLLSRLVENAGNCRRVFNP